jgi:type IV pilus assembly protein PilE
MRPARGFTLIELMIAIAIAAILVAIALPSYTAYVKRSKVPAALDALSALATRMEQCYQDTGSYSNCAACTAGSIPQPPNFTVSCPAATWTSTAFTAQAVGTGTMTNYTYTIDQSGNRATTSHPRGSNTGCWTTRGSTCDT